MGKKSSSQKPVSTRIHSFDAPVHINTLIGKDATESFEDVGHSDEAREILDTLFIGTLAGEPEVCHFPYVRVRTS